MNVQTQAARLTSQRVRTFTARRMDSIIGRTYSLALVLTGVEMVSHATEQLPFLNPWIFALTFGFTVFSIIGMVVRHWFHDVTNTWYILHAASVALNLVLWPLELNPGVHFNSDFAPYFFWSLGWGAMSAGLGLRPLLAGAYIVALPMAFFVLQTSNIGGVGDVHLALQNSIYTFLISASISALLQLVRRRAADQDIASEKATAAASAAAAANAIARERTRLDGMVHNQVLGALNAAINAYSPEQKKVAADLARGAIQRLEGYGAEKRPTEDQVNVVDFFAELGSLIQQETDQFQVSTSVEGAFNLPLEVATALGDATVQAVTNSLLHAGSGKLERHVKLRAWDDQSLKITVVDAGRGFRPSRVPKSRLGMRRIIFRGVEQVGGRAHINSRPGEGASVILEWGCDA